MPHFCAAFASFLSAESTFDAKNRTSPLLCSKYAETPDWWICNFLWRRTFILDIGLSRH
jgi:hypothetical protein